VTNFKTIPKPCPNVWARFFISRQPNRKIVRLGGRIKNQISMKKLILMPKTSRLCVRFGWHF